MEQPLRFPGSRSPRTPFAPDAVYHMPHIPEVGSWGPAAIIKVLAAYTSDDDTRPVLHFINLDSDWASATDGHRFVRVAREHITLPIPDGVYRPVKDGADWLLLAVPHTLELPDMERVVPEALESFELPQFDPNGKTDIGALLYKLARKGICISHSFCEDIPRGKYQVHLADPGKAVIFEGNFTVGIMPMQPGTY